MIFSFEAQFSAAHFYKNKNWGHQKNQETFGKCFTEYGHGHDYKLEVSLDCQESDAADHHQRIRKICNELDHQHINFVIPEFKTKIPTTENLAEYLLIKINHALNKKAEVLRLRLFESPQVWVELSF